MMRGIRRVLSVAAVMLATACVDTTPLDYVEPPEPDAAVATVDAAAVDGTVANACEECVTGEGAPCRPQYDGCLDVPRCPELVACLMDDGCFSIAQIDDRIDCATPCFELFKISTGVEPEVEAALPINACTQTACRDACIVE